ncbi:MAG: hypothetical protein J7L16_05855, partial [Deltaproteobacteria bacterium]|nr:hypothetical protein [Deltaproteobacteria bacterium]
PTPGARSLRLRSTLADFRYQLLLPQNEGCQKMNDLQVFNRQKNNGMSWSKEGSVALASINATERNKKSEKWFEKK